MHYLQQFGAIIILGTLSANTAAAPAPAPAANASQVIGSLEPRKVLHDHAGIINAYSDPACGGKGTQKVISGPKSHLCYYIGGSSIQVSAV